MIALTLCMNLHLSHCWCKRRLNSTCIFSYSAPLCYDICAIDVLVGTDVLLCQRSSELGIDSHGRWARGEQ